MTPILRQLKSWQAREWVYSASVAVAVVVLVAVGGIALACTADNLLDLGSWDGTPFWVRLLTLLQAVLYVGAVYFAIRSVKAPSLVALASRAEAEFTEYDHRLVTALQLNRPDARTAGMSQQLITALTDEALDTTARRKLAALADPKRLLWAGVMLMPVLLILLVAFGLFPQSTAALLQRQLLLPVDIPRNVTVENVSVGPFPAGDPMQVRVRVTGPVKENSVGEVRVTPEGGEPKFHLIHLSESTGVKFFHTTDGTARYPLRYAGPADGGGRLFVADLPPATEPFRFAARIGDGRMKPEAELRYEPRPVVTKVDAWVLAPAYVDPDGKRRFETVAKQGEVVCHPDCSVRVRAEFSKPVKKAEVVLAGVRKGEPKEGAGNPQAGGEVAPPPVRFDVRLPLDLDAGRTAGTTTFTIPPGVSGYRIEVTDDFDLNNLTPPRRGISVLPDRPPTVLLNDELLMAGSDTGPLDDYEVRGIPLILGGQIQIGYQARSSLGVARAAIIYRVNDGPWTQFNLKQVTVDPEKVGRFRPELGIFESYDEAKNNEFYPVPANDPDEEPSGLVAGGRYNFLTAALVKTAKDGAVSKLAVGDRVEFRVVVYDRKHDVIDRARGVLTELLRAGGPSSEAVKAFAELPLPETEQVKAARAALAADPKTAGPALRAVQAALQPDRPIAMTDTDLAARPAEERVGLGRPAGYSESRLKAVVTDTAFKQWQEQQARSRERLRELEKVQQGVFGEKKKP